MSAETKNTDKRIWKKVPGDAFSPSIHITAENGVGMDVGGHVIVAPIEIWHEAMRLMMSSKLLPWYQRKMIIWLLNKSATVMRRKMMEAATS